MHRRREGFVIPSHKTDSPMIATRAELAACAGAAHIATAYEGFRPDVAAELRVPLNQRAERGV